jgi:hypothetical protein
VWLRLVGSRGPVIGILLAFFLAVEPMLQQLAFLGDGRGVLPSMALKRIGDLPPVSDIHVALGRRSSGRDRVGGRRGRGRSVAHSHTRDLIDVGRRRGYAQWVFPALPAWLGKPSPRVVDVLVAVVVGLPVIGTSVGSGAAQDRALAGLVVGVASVAALLVRRRWPFGTLVAILAIAVASPVDGQFVLPLGVALYTIGSTRSWEAAFAGAALVVGTGLVYILAGGPGWRTRTCLRPRWRAPWPAAWASMSAASARA